MVKMKTATCPTCGGIVFKLAGKASRFCYDECPECRNRRADEERQAAEREASEDERRRLENEEMAQHFEQHPHG